MPALARDSFAGAVGAALTSRPPEIGSNWAYRVGSADLVVGGGRLRCEATTERIATFAAPATPNYSVALDLWPASLLAADETGVVGRMVGPNDWYGARYSRAAGQWQLLKKTTADGLVVLQGYTEALTAAQLRSARLVMEANRIRLEVAPYQGAFVERVAVTDTALTAAGEAGVRFLPGTAHTATTGLQLEGVRVASRRRVDTAWTSSGAGRVTAGKEDLIGGPRIPAAPGTRRGVVCGDGANQPPVEAYDLLHDLAREGFVSVAVDSWDVGAAGAGAGVGWGNDAAVARWRTAWNHIKAHHGAKGDKVLLVGISGDGLNALKFALAYPTEVAAIALPIAAVNLKDLHDRNVDGYQQEIRDAYGGTLSSFNTNEPTANPWNRLTELAGIPIYCWWSEDDPNAKREFMEDITEQVATAKGEGHGSVGHGYGPHSLSYPADVAEFLSRHAA